MNKIFQYIKNIGTATARIPLAVFWIYHYHPHDGYLKNLAIVALDLPLNTLLGGDPDETLSSRSSKAQGHEQGETPPTWGWGCRLCSFLAAFQQNHCQKAYERWAGKQAVIPDE